MVHCNIEPGKCEIRVRRCAIVNNRELAWPRKESAGAQRKTAAPRGGRFGWHLVLFGRSERPESGQRLSRGATFEQFDDALGDSDHLLAPSVEGAVKAARRSFHAGHMVVAGFCCKCEKCEACCRFRKCDNSRPEKEKCRRRQHPGAAPPFSVPTGRERSDDRRAQQQAAGRSRYKQRQDIGCDKTHGFLLL